MAELSRQRVWQLKKAAEGLCTNCGRIPVPGKRRCVLCLKQAHMSKRKANGYKPWKEGGPGRPPMEKANG